MRPKASKRLVDLADVLGIKPEDISLGGQLGLAIGARGTGNALAHYEPELKVINLTRAGGVGSLAHEWGHALDHSLTDFSKGFMSDEYRFTHQSVQNGRVWRMEEKDATASARLNPEELSNIEIRRAYRAFFRIARIPAVLPPGPRTCPGPWSATNKSRSRKPTNIGYPGKRSSLVPSNAMYSENSKHRAARTLIWLGSKKTPISKVVCGQQIKKPIR
jgi:hypothetical protein